MPEQDVVVNLSPVHARHLAGALRVELGMRWESVALGPVPCREEVERLRALLDEYGEQLERLDWGEPAGDVRVRWRADVVIDLERQLRQGAEECFVDSPRDDDGREMLDTAQALAVALEATPGITATA